MTLEDGRTILVDDYDVSNECQACLKVQSGEHTGWMCLECGEWVCVKHGAGIHSCIDGPQHPVTGKALNPIEHVSKDYADSVQKKTNESIIKGLRIAKGFVK